MMFLSHLLFGIIAGNAGCSFTGCSNSVLFIALAAIASIFPDIDALSSKISGKLKPFAVVINFVFGHRGFMHSVFPAFILYFIFLAAVGPQVAAAILIGYLSHLALDALTPAGIMPFHPFLKLKLSGQVKVNSILEKIILLALFAAVVIGVYRRFG